MVLAKNARIADTFLSRMVGLLDRAALAPQEGLVITRCQSIHMLFMRFPIDVVFVGRDHQVVGLVEGIKPYQLSPIFFRSSYAVEVPEGVIQQSQTARGDIIELRPTQ